MSTVEQVVVLAGFAVTVIGLVWALSSRGRAFRKRYPNLARLAIDVAAWLATIAAIIAFGVELVKLHHTTVEVAVLSSTVLALVVLVMTIGARCWELMSQLEDLQRRHKFVREDRDVWKDIAETRQYGNDVLRRQLAHVVVAANTTPAPTSPTDNETSAA